MTAPPVPVGLLGPVLDVAADLIVDAKAGELPLTLRPLSAFDRRGLLRGPARETLRRALDTEDAFRNEVVEVFMRRPEVASALDGLEQLGIVRTVEHAVERDDLALLVSALWAARPPDWEFALGVAVSREESRRRQLAQDDDLLSQERRVAESDEARRRAEAALVDMQREVERLTTQVREDRGARRSEIDAARRASDDAERRAARVEATLEEAREQLRELDARAHREAKRARDMEDDLRRLRRERDEARERLQSAENGSARASIDPADLRLLSDAGDAVRGVAAALDAVVGRLDPQRGGARRAPRDGGAVPAGRSEPVERAPARRATPNLPGGLVADSADGLTAMLRTPGVLLVVDGYNVSKHAWGGAPLADQRQRLCAALGAVHQRTGAEVVVVFDGDDSVVLPPLRRPGLQVLFSAPEQQADDVVVAVVAEAPRRTPALAVSSDHWVREHASEEGAVVVSSDTLLKILGA